MLPNDAIDATPATTRVSDTSEVGRYGQLHESEQNDVRGANSRSCSCKLAAYLPRSRFALNSRANRQCNKALTMCLWYSVYI